MFNQYYLQYFYIRSVSINILQGFDNLSVNATC
jgi:hypothetical protein